MRSDVETGLNITTYSDRLRDLNFAYKEVESSEVGSEEFRKEAKLAVEAYRNAGAAWSLKLTFHDDEITFRKPRYGKKGDKLWMPPDPDFLKDQEELATLNLMIIGSGAFEGRTSGTIDELLQFYWTKAKEHSDLAVAEI